MSNFSLEPSIRFKKFNDKWKSLKIYEIGEYISTSNLGYIDLNEDGKFPCVLYGDLYTKYKETIFNIESKTIKMATEIKKNDILFPTSTTVDALSLISPSCVNVDTAVAGGDLFVIRPYDKIDGNFISYCINNKNELKSKLSKRAQGITIIHLQFNNIKEEQIIIPSKNEQKKISELGISIDKLINIEQKKYDKLIAIKKSLLEKMFPKGVNKVPQIRFEGFSDLWTSLQLKDIIKIYPYKKYLAKDFSFGIIPVIQQGSDPVVGFSNQSPFMNFDKVVLFGDHTLSLYKPEEPFLIATDGVKILEAINDIDGYYFYSLLERNIPASEGYKRHFSVLKQAEILAANQTREMQSIGSYFKKIDYLIDLRYKKIEKLKNIKSALLNKMFV